ncbi:MAG TPA: M14 metallopeptidase family protein [Planctomycetota bacterium]|nr:M14 metallopeptidase family protein [Planctomycetota bacterium]
MRALRPLCFLSLVLPALAPSASPQVPSPKDFLGHEVGADYQLCNYTDLVRYFQAIEQKSDRMRLVDIGASSYGQRMLMAVISSPQNLARIERLRAICQQLSKGRGVDAAQAAAFAEEGRSFVWIDAGLHASEAIAGQNIIELVWQMNSRNDDEVRRILDEVVLLACPVNPDGLELIANAYRATRSMSIPVLYQRYIGHDNNRDFYICNQVEAQNVNRVFYTDWCPQIVYNHHQSAPSGTIIFTPPFRDPFNYYTDPMVIRGIEIVSAHMNQRFAAEGKPGVISRSGAPYSGWWNGGLRSTNYFHNVIGILTESFGRPEPTPIRQTLNRRLPYGDYPDPVPSQTWHARQTVEYLQTANFAILDYAARYRRELLQQIWTMASRAIERGSRDNWTPTPLLVSAAERREEPESVFTDPMLRDPRVYVLRSDQPDWSAAQRLVRALRRCGVEVLRATAPFELGGGSMPAGSFVVKTDQAYRAHVLDMFEAQHHPDDIKDGKPVPPYDAAGWTLAMQMDVQVERGFDALDGPFEVVEGPDAFEPRLLAAPRAGWQLDPRDSHTVVAVNRLLAADVPVEWSPRGHFWVPAGGRAMPVLRDAAMQLGVAAVARETDTREARERVHAPRLGLFDVYGGHMATGWDQWILREFEFPTQQVFGDRIEAGNLGRDFDVLVFHTGLPGQRDLTRAAQRRDPANFEKLAGALPPFEDWSNLEARATALTGEKALPALREFVEQGGTLIALGGECDKVIRHFDLPIEVGTHVPTEDGERRTTREEYYVPGSLLALEVDTSHPIARGTSHELAAMVNNGSVIMEVTDPKAPIDVVARYRGMDTLVSGWAIGEDYLIGKAAVLCAHVGKGRVLLYGADVTYRGQPVGTFKLLFEGILTSGRAR